MALAFESNPGSQTTVLLNGDVTRSSVTRALEHIADQVTADDQVWLYFSGMGFQHREAGYLGLSDTSASNLLANSLAATELVAWLKDLRAKQALVMVDACHSGLVSNHKGVMPYILGGLAERTEGKVWLAAGAADELAFEDSTLGHGLFTYSVLDGLSGKADFDSDGFVTALELATYVKYAVATVANGRGQHPWMQTIDGSPDFTISVANRSVAPTPQGTALPTHFTR